MEATKQWTTFITHQSRPWLLVGSLLVGRNTEEAMILLVGDQLLGPKGALLVDLLLVESSPPRYFALLVGSRLVDVPLRDTHGRDTKVTNSSTVLSRVSYDVE
jgi:hypothetical protein